MLYNYLKVAIRQLLKNKLYVIINTLGVGAAIGSAMTSYLLIAYNIEFDSSVDNDRVKNIVKVIHHRTHANGDPFKELVAPIALAPIAADEMSGIKSYTRFCSTGGYLSYKGEGFHETIFFADAAFMSMFQPKLVSGSHESFHDKNTIFINEKYAAKYFGKEPPLGREIEVQFNGRRLTAVVGGVMVDAPFNSTFTQNVLMRIENFIDLYDINENDWSAGPQISTLFELSDIEQATIIAQQFNKYVVLRNEAVSEAGSIRYDLLPFLDPLSPNDVRRSDLHLRIPNIALMIFSLLGGIILLIACFNLTNTTLAISMKRFKEIGIRKVVGSKKRQIAFQFLLETAITVAISVVTGFVLSLFMIPQFASMWELPYGLKDISATNMLIALCMLLTFVALLAGTYPALIGSRQSPVALFKSVSSRGGTNFFTRTLLVAQFSLSVVVLVSGTTFTRNAAWQDRVSFGYDKNMLITALIQGPGEARVLSDAIAGNPDIVASSPSIHHFAFINAPEYDAKIGDDPIDVTMYDIGPDYFPTVGIPMLSGRMFNSQDTIGRTEIVVDEIFVQRHGLVNPLGTTIEVQQEKLTIVGVVGDHLTDLESNNTENYVYRLARPSQYQILVVRADKDELKQTEAFIQAEWKKLFPDQPLRTDLQQEILYLEANAYNGNLSKIFLFMTVMGCMLSLSGLYSLASLNVHKRQKEIGIRKVLGATVPHILRLLNTEFTIILTIAGALGATGGYILTQGLLSDLFAQHIELTFMPVALCALLIFIVGISATSLTIRKAAINNPAKVLKTE
jgi:ABC-type antimicrobial peptide transport system permease subunit